MVNVPDTAQSLSDDYAKMGAYIGLATDDPGNSPTPANEVDAPGYTRQPVNWMPGNDAGVNQGMPVTFTLPSGTYPYMILFNDNGDMMDSCTLNNAVLNTDGEIVVIPTYTQT